MGLRDPLSSASHLLAAVWAVYASLAMLRSVGPGVGRRVSVAVFGGSMVLLYLASGVYHAVPFSATHHPEALRIFQTADRSAVFVLIAGTNTPVMTCLLSGRWRRTCLRAIWGLALVGVVTLWVLPRPPFVLTVSVYVGMGWLGAVPLAQYVRAVSWRGIFWAAVGGILYTAGAVCDLVKWPAVADAPVRVGPHEVFHLATVAGSVAFYVFISRYVLRYTPPPERSPPAERP